VIGVTIGCNRGKATGNRNRDIADRLFISEETVKAHMKHILQKLGATDRTQAVTIAARSEASFRPLFFT
jgi:DNA-binding NarL/FixJ family response regulator